MSSENHKLHIFFFPFLAHGHMIPTVDMAKLFATRGVKTTVITTPVNASFFSKTIQRSKDLGIDIDLKILKFPATEVGLPDGCENLDMVVNMDMSINFVKAITLLQEPLELLLQECKPDCLVADMLFPWSVDAAGKYGIPRLVFHGTCFFSVCADLCVELHKPHKKVLSDSEPFLVPYLPGDIKLTRSQLPDYVNQDIETLATKLIKEARESESKSYGVVVNSFYELESAYADFYRNDLGKRAWHIGPVSAANRNFEDKSTRRKQASIDEHECLKWLNSKKPNSVVYVCFGSLANFSSSQLMEIAIGLEASEQQFIWVVRKERKDNQEVEDWLPVGFEKRVEGKGLVIRGWAPQVMILDHEAIGGFVTHCGWNSTLEGITAGLPMVTWPVFAEQFYNEKLVTQVLKIGVSVGVRKWSRHDGDLMKREAVEKAVKEIMVGEKADEMRSRAKALGDKARRVVEKDGSSYSDLSALFEELKA